MITFECATMKGLLECASLSIPEDSICTVLTETDYEINLLLKVLTGMEKIDSGKLFIFGDSIASLPADKLNKIRKRIGVVPGNGGLISNLKVWENLMLPLIYHGSMFLQDIEAKMFGVINRIGYDDDLNALPGPLPVYKKRLAGLARAMLMDPDLMIYDSVFEGLSPDIKNKITDAIIAFHNEKKSRASLFLSSDENLLNDIRADRVYMLKKGRFYERD